MTALERAIPLCPDGRLLALAALPPATPQAVSTRCWSSPGRRASSTRRPPRASRRSRSSARSAGSSSSDGGPDASSAPTALAVPSRVVFLNTSGDVLTDAQQAAFERLVPRRRRLRRHPLGDRDRARLDVPDRHPRHALHRRVGRRRRRRSRSPTACTTPARACPSTGSAPTSGTTSPRNVRGRSHVLATVDETTYTGGTMGFDHPVAWCKDLRRAGARSTRRAATPPRRTPSPPSASTSPARIDWAAGEADPVYSDCGATVLANYEQKKISAPPNLNEPIGFDQLPDGRIMQTARGGQLRLHDPATGSSAVIATMPVYTNSEDGLYGPAVDNDFATNRWVYLYYAPPMNMDAPYPATHAGGRRPGHAAGGPERVGPVEGLLPALALQVRRRRGSEPPRLDLASEQKILKVDNNRGACCHVAGDIDFDRTTTSGWSRATTRRRGGWELRRLRAVQRHADERDADRARRWARRGGTFTLTFDGQTTAPIAFNATAAHGAGGARGARATSARRRRRRPAGNGQHRQPDGRRSAARYSQAERRPADADARRSDRRRHADGATARRRRRADCTTRRVTTRGAARSTPTTCAARCCASKSAPDGSYTVPAGNLFPESEDADDKTRPEIYAMGFRNPFRIQVDENDVAYVTDYSPDASVPGPFRGPAGTGRMEIVRRPANYGWPVCYRPTSHSTSGTSTPDDARRRRSSAATRRTGRENASRWNTGRDR